jgi:hypothetical protein
LFVLCAARAAAHLLELRAQLLTVLSFSAARTDDPRRDLDAARPKMTTMAPPAGSTPEPLREIKRQRRERLAKPDENLANDTVESYLVKQRDLILAEMDGLTGRLVADHHDAVSKAKEALRQECPAAKPIAGPRAVTMVATTGPHKGIAFKMTVGAAACFVGRSGGKKFREKGISLPKDNEVSTTHAKIELKNDEIVLVDVGSTNGTSVDGEPIEEGKPHPLAAGNTVVFGASTFTVSEIKAA